MLYNSIHVFSSRKNIQKKKKSERRKLLIKINYLCEIIFSLICEQMK